MRSPAPPHAVQVLSHLDEPKTLGLLENGRALIEIERALLPALPRGVAANACQLEAGLLVLAVPSPAAAAKLRQTLPRIGEHLRNRGWKVSAIHVRVQPPESLDASRAYSRTAAPDIPASALGAFETLHDALDNEPLKGAILRLLSRRRIS